MLFSEEIIGFAYGSDIFLDVISAAVMLLLFIAVFRFAKLSSNVKRYRSMLWGFGLLAAGFAAKILSHVTIYYHSEFARQAGLLTVTHHSIQASHALVFWGLFSYRILVLFGLYGLYKTYAQKDDKSTCWFMGLLLALAAWLTAYAYVLFHVVAIAFLAWIAMHLIRQGEKKSTRTLGVGFGFLALSNVVFIIMAFVWQLYYIAEILQVFGILVMLGTFLIVTTHGKKTRSD